MNNKKESNKADNTGPAAQPVEPPKMVLSAINSVLRALVRLLLNFQITYPQVSELLKQAYVDVADKEFALGDKKQTDTRISVITGVHRKDTKRIRQEIKEGDMTPKHLSVGVQVIAKWISDKAYVDAKGKAKPLTLRGPAPNFESLVQSIGRQDFGSRALLDQWLNLGIASMQDDKVVLNQESFIPNEGLDEKAFFMGMNLSDHLNAINHNLMEQQPPFFERCVYYDGLSESAVAELQTLAQAECMRAIKTINKQAIELKKKKKGQGNKRFNTGAYVFHEEEVHESEKAAEKEKANPDA